MWLALFYFNFYMNGAHSCSKIPWQVEELASTDTKFPGWVLRSHSEDAWNTATRNGAVAYRGVGMMVHVDSKPLALSSSSLVVGTAQGDVNHYGRPLCGMADVLIAARQSLLQSSTPPG